MQIRKKIEQLNIICGQEIIDCLPSEEQARKNARRSIVLAHSVEEGEILREQDLTFKRPGIGISPSEFENVLGKRFLVTIKLKSLEKFLK